MASQWWVYMLECGGGRLYTGVTTDVAARYAAHCSGKGAAFTRMHKPQRILATERVATRSEALQVEARIKKWTRPAKLAWAQERRWSGALPT